MQPVESSRRDLLNRAPRRWHARRTRHGTYGQSRALAAAPVIGSAGAAIPFGQSSSMRRFGGMANLRRGSAAISGALGLLGPTSAGPTHPHHSMPRLASAAGASQTSNRINHQLKRMSPLRPTHTNGSEMAPAANALCRIGMVVVGPRARDRRQAHGRNAAPCQRDGLERRARASSGSGARVPPSAGGSRACGRAANAPADGPVLHRRHQLRSEAARRPNAAFEQTDLGRRNSDLNLHSAKPRRHHLVTAYAESPSTLSMRSSSGAGRSVPRSRAPVAERSTSAAACERVRVVNIAISGRCSRSARRLPPP